MPETSISWSGVFCKVPDLRASCGKRHSLTTVLKFCSVAMLYGYRLPIFHRPVRPGPRRPTPLAGGP